MKIAFFFNVEVEIFSNQNSFSQNDEGRQIIFFRTNYERIIKSFDEHLYVTNTPDFETVSYIFLHLVFSSIFFLIGKHLSYLNLIFVNL